MARLKTIPDPEIFAAVQRLLAEGGEKSVAFASVGRATGLAASTLVQRYGSRDAMLRAALFAAWDTLDAATAKAEANASPNEKGALALLKALGRDHGVAIDLAQLAADFRNPDLRARAESWRRRVEAALAIRHGDGAKGREAAALLFALWQGQNLWQPAGGKGFRLKDALRRLNG
ncbi:MAG: transcriptional regulator [Paracoccaceae bacterium]|nr:transcriptional regulator [Paracoccaceae bacterium]